jgi:hypothetical protein
MRGVDPDELGAAAEVDLDQLPAMDELALGIARPRQPYARACGGEADHRSRIGAVHGDRLARRERHVGEEALVAPDERGGNERGGKAHRHMKEGRRSRRPCDLVS